MKHHINIPIFIPHFGCPFQCIFCNQNKIASVKGIPRTSDIVAVIEQYLSIYHGDGEDVEIAFFGGSFTAIDPKIQKEYLEVVQPYLANGRVGSIRVSTRPDFIDHSILSLLASYRVKTIELGAQSLSNEVLKASGRGYKCTDVFKASHCIKSSGLKLGVQLMIGLPEDNYNRDIDTARKVVGLKPDMVRIYPTLVIAQTPLERLFYENSYTPLSLAEAINTCKEMLLIFQENGINVIRIGLHPGEELRSSGTVVAGPFHPSLGEMVEQEIFKEQALVAIKKYQEKFRVETDFILLVHEKDISKMTGNKRVNIRYLQDLFGLKTLKVKAYSGLSRDTVALGPANETKPVFCLSREEFIRIRQINCF
ncbi:MAG: elongator complex protein 3 [Syntrophomonadaceae bacterium]